ncbi:Transmembrane 9 superfamily member 7 [Zea mays]|uniref:Transmembrane 9 superfamily member n=1 Tax=Zea mays TaxID=4577 RepID=A0A3L6DHH3_MAIZE|nr:Transmembrane 9 superfamily member 7 [Zea mays]
MCKGARPQPPWLRPESSVGGRALVELQGSRRGRNRSSGCDAGAGQTRYVEEAGHDWTLALPGTTQDGRASSLARRTGRMGHARPHQQGAGSAASPVSCLTKFILFQKNWACRILDYLLVVVPRRAREGSQTPSFEHGYRVGYKLKDDKYYMNNHLSFKVLYHEDQTSPDARIVGFHVIPSRFAIFHDVQLHRSSISTSSMNMVPRTTIISQCKLAMLTLRLHLVVTLLKRWLLMQMLYSLMTLLLSDIKWASRWDVYLLSCDSQIHWFSIVNSLMIVLFLSSMVAMIMMRTLYKDIANYNQLDNQDEAQEETGWKLVHGDVFRPPVHSGLLCVYVGTGVQFFGMTLVTMMFALLGFLSPANRGGLMTAMVLLWVFMGVLARYTSSRLYKMFKGTEWKKITLKTAFMFPGIIFSVFFFLNALIWGEKSSSVVPFGTMFVLFLLWFGISVPLVFVGSFLGFKQPAIEDLVKTNKIPKQIPEQAWYLQPIFVILAGGILPFGAVFIELFFILTSIWLNQFYYIFGFLFIVFVILIVTCAEITIVLCYFQLCTEDYHWWWRAYLTAGSSTLYLFVYAIFYFFNKWEITKLVSGIMYFGYMLIISYAFFCADWYLWFLCLLLVREEDICFCQDRLIKELLEKIILCS